MSQNRRTARIMLSEEHSQAKEAVHDALARLRVMRHIGNTDAWDDGERNVRAALGRYRVIRYAWWEARNDTRAYRS